MMIGLVSYDSEQVADDDKIVIIKISDNDFIFIDV